MPAIEAQGLEKSFGGRIACRDISFAVERGEVFGLLGPNGAGKTTTIRVLMDIFKPDSGAVSVLGQPPGAARARVGYLPEERGLYKKMQVRRVLAFLAELKGDRKSVV